MPMIMNTYQPREFQQQQPRLNGGNNYNRRNNRHHQQTKNEQGKDMNGCQQPLMCNGAPNMDEPIEQLSQMTLGKQDSAPITA